MAKTIKKSPEVNDWMYNGTTEKYEYWNGSSWIDASVTDADFKFDYAKYIETWNIAHPDIVMIMLGKNDFYSGITNEIWIEWKNRLNILIDSIKSYSESVKIAICTPTTPTLFLIVTICLIIKKDITICGKREEELSVTSIPETMIIGEYSLSIQAFV